MKKLLIVIAFLALAGCIAIQLPQQEEQARDPTEICISMCDVALAQGQDLSAGPCLGMIDDEFVCDVAHDPRTDVDNQRENQCDEWHSGLAQGFVEVTPECTFITKHHKQ